MSTKNKVIGVRVDDEELAKLEAFEKRTRIASVTLFRAAFEAAMDFYEKHGYLTFPLVIVPVEYALTVTMPAPERASHQQRKSDDPSQVKPLPLDAQSHRSHRKFLKRAMHDPANGTQVTRIPNAHPSAKGS